ncbi:hypothetical protein, partial [Burkholderia sp. MSh2]|uniref:hypothetical protein n=1 Tax=Burkholderia sp. MSh2 TaxID=1506588 RepID=UPI001F1D4FC7
MEYRAANSPDTGFDVEDGVRIQPVDATHLKLHSSEECCNETEAADLLYRQSESGHVGALAQG